MTPEQLPSPMSTNQEIPPIKEEMDPRRRTFIIIGISIGVLLLTAAIIYAVVFLMNHADTASVVRDVFIIFMALEFLVIGLVLILLFFQLAKLTNLLQNEIKPILESTNETVSTVRGTTQFLSDNLTDPVIKLSGYFAGAQQVFRTIRPSKKNK